MFSPTLFVGTRGELQGFRKLIQIGSPHWGGRRGGRRSRTIDQEASILALGFLPARFGSCIRRERPHSRAAEKRDELAPLHRCNHSITSSASASNLSGTSRPSAFAVLRFMIISNLVGSSTGRSAGLSPLRMRPA